MTVELSAAVGLVKSSALFLPTTVGRHRTQPFVLTQKSVTPTAVLAMRVIKTWSSELVMDKQRANSLPKTLFLVTRVWGHTSTWKSPISASQLHLQRQHLHLLVLSDAILVFLSHSFSLSIYMSRLVGKATMWFPTQTDLYKYRI